jgi:hypothetical protein
VYGKASVIIFVINFSQLEEIGAFAVDVEGRLLIKETWVQFQDTLCVIYVGKGTYGVCCFMFPRCDVLKAVVLKI